MAEKPPFAEPDALAEWIGEGIDATSADWKRARRVLRAASNLVRTQTGATGSTTTGRWTTRCPNSWWT